MTLHLLVRALGILLIVVLVLFKPRWVRPLSLSRVFSLHDTLAGEHGFDRAAYIGAMAIAFGLLIWLAFKLAPLFREGEVLFWALIAGALLAVAAVRFWPRKPDIWEWHNRE